MVFGKYQVIKRLAVGGMGEIFLARQTNGINNSERFIILKTLLPNLARESGHVEQFLDEARVAAFLHHPNIVEVYEVGPWQDTYIIAMEFIRGENLARLMTAIIRNNESLPRHLAAKIVHGAALALHHAHQSHDTDGHPLGVVHRDIGLQNIMIDHNGVTKVVDFGIAQAIHKTSIKSSKLVKGKLRYMSPEQVLNKELDGRSDQFSLGIVLWELVTGRRLLKDKEDTEVIKILTQSDISTPKSIDPSVPDELNFIISKMLKRDREQRYTNCREVAIALAKYIEENEEDASEDCLADYIKRHLPENIIESPLEHHLEQEHEVFTFATRNKKKATTQETTRVNIQQQQIKLQNKKQKNILVLTLILISIISIALITVGAVIWRNFRYTTPSSVHIVEYNPPQPPLASLKISTIPAGAQIFQDEHIIGISPVTINTLQTDTTYEFKLAKEGYQESFVSVTLSSKESRIIYVSLSPLVDPLLAQLENQENPFDEASDKLTQFGFFVLSSKPGNKVAIDGKYYGNTPINKIKLSPGNHILRINTEDTQKLITRKFNIRIGSTTKMKIK
ncbi:MAG: serine/threonine protein kinase [Deltaproteobacteria bacterium]|nr:serine/threonine protein kinase [Deltaproteobacteria bacterium]